jgi:hypothetical protein
VERRILRGREGTEAKEELRVVELGVEGLRQSEGGNESGCELEEGDR